VNDPAGRWRWAPPALWAAALVVTTSWPNPGVPQVGQADKLVHVLLYGVLAWLVGRAEPTLAVVRRRAVLTIVALACFAALDEWHQGFVPGRAASRADWAADVVGAAAGLTLITVGRRRAA
jgi:VanZ family protein